MAKEEQVIYVKEFYTLEQLSQELGFSILSLRNFIKNGKLKASVIGHKYIVYRNDIIKWLADNQTK